MMLEWSCFSLALSQSGLVECWCSVELSVFNRTPSHGGECQASCPAAFLLLSS